MIDDNKELKGIGEFIEKDHPCIALA